MNPELVIFLTLAIALVVGVIGFAEINTNP